MNVRYKRIMIYLVCIVSLFLFSCDSSSPSERLPITPINVERNIYFETDYSIQDYTIYTKNIGMCDSSFIIAYFSTTERNYADTVHGCVDDPYYYVKYSDEYLTLNEAADKGLFTDEEVINEFVNLINE